jgi:hypothetical protein
VLCFDGAAEQRAAEQRAAEHIADQSTKRRGPVQQPLCFQLCIIMALDKIFFFIEFIVIRINKVNIIYFSERL